VEVGRYIGLERLIEHSKERYYETLKLSSEGWHEGKHNPWPYVNYLLFTLLDGYKEFEQRIGQTASPRGSKTTLVLTAVDRRVGSFQVADLQRDCPGVSLDLIRRVLKKKRESGEIECVVRGRNSLWSKTDRWNLGNSC
jgi:hypothetical protein